MPMEMSRSRKCYVERAEHHRKHDGKGAMEAADFVRKFPRVLGDGDPGMPQLKE
jgi:hypothetical protein